MKKLFTLLGLILCLTMSTLAANYVPIKLREITDYTIVYESDITSDNVGANAAQNGWLCYPASYSTSDKNYVNVTDDESGNPKGIADVIPSASSVKMLQIKADANTFTSEKRVIHMHVKGITGVIGHGMNNNSGNRGMAISCTEYVDGLSTMDESSHHAEVTRTGAGSFIVQVNNLNPEKEYVVSIYATAGDTFFYCAEFLVPEKEDPDALPKANISWSASEVSYKVREANLPTAPTFSNSENLKVSFNSTDPEIASVDESGNVTLSSAKEGTAVVSATFDGDETHSKTTASFTVNVITNVKNETIFDPNTKVQEEPISGVSLLWSADKKEGAISAGTLCENDYLKITTPYNSKYTNYANKYLGQEFSGAAQLGRSAGKPSSTDLTGGEYLSNGNPADNSPLIITPTQDLTLVVYGRRQSVTVGSGIVDDVENNIVYNYTYAGVSTTEKGLYFVDQADLSTIDQTIIVGVADVSYPYVAVLVNLQAGHTYTAYTTGTTYQVNGIGYIFDESAIELNKAIADAKAIDWDLYSEETAKALADAIKAAEELLAQGSPESSALAEAKTKIDDAKGKLSAVEQVIPTGEHTYVFYNWSDATVANLKADAANSNTSGWSDEEKTSGNTTGEASKDNCFWLADKQVDENGYLLANSEVIAETKGLQFIEDAFKRNLAIAVNYPEALGTYEGGAYLWLGGSGKNYFVIKEVKAGSVIKMGVESHKPSEGRGVELYVTEDGSSHSGNKLVNQYGYDVIVPTTYKNSTWQVPGEDGTVDIMVYNTNGCHIYYIDVESAKVEEEEPETQSTIISFDNVNSLEEVTLTQEGADSFKTYNDKITYNGQTYNGIQFASTNVTYTLHAPEGYVLTTSVKVIGSENNNSLKGDAYIAEFADGKFSLEDTKVETYRQNPNEDRDVFNFEIPAMDKLSFVFANREFLGLLDVTYVSEELIPHPNEDAGLEVTFNGSALTDGVELTEADYTEPVKYSRPDERYQLWYYFEEHKDAAVEEPADEPAMAALNPEKNLSVRNLPFQALDGDEINLNSKGALYYYVKDTETGLNSRLAIVGIGDTITGVENVTVDVKNDGVIYNVYGQRVNENYRGVVIKNGQKYIQK